jgi:threonine/homoserine/homoserine lactone efflux protein
MIDGPGGGAVPRRDRLRLRNSIGILVRMGSLLAHMVLLGLAASVSPVSITVMITLMLTKNPLRNALAFLAGFTLVLVAMGVLSVFVFHAGTAHKTGTVDGWIDIGFGVLCLAVIPLSIRRKPKEEKPGDEQSAKPFTAGKSFVVGMGTMAVNASTIVIYLSATHLIAAAKLSTFDDLIALIVLTLVTLITLIIPILIYAIFPSRAEKVLTSLKGWLARHRKVIAVSILVVIGAYLLIKGIKIVVYTAKKGTTGARPQWCPFG